MTSEHERLLQAISPIIVERGLKSTTMDLVARRLGMSKRTLYEIFDNKPAMIREVLRYHAECSIRQMRNIINNSPNVMIALLRIFDFHRKEMEGMNVSFFKDMDRLYPEFRDEYEKRHEEHRNYLNELYRKGIKEGVFRPDVNFYILSRFMQIHSESLKRMEELFPPEITLAEIYGTMTEGFLRAIASREGHDILDNYFHPET
ncbi:MAG: TetR/AcrR family transcriptional regulator [Muribaculaceae bacterium]|nr:TetR/AcrR family transcriptional regulator [Muribaculaceae bacterium]